MSAGAIVAWYNAINAGIRWLSGERGQSSHFWQDFQHIPSQPDTGGGPPCIRDNGPSLVITGILFNSAPGRRSSFGVDMKNEAPLYLNCIFDGLRSVNNNGSCWNNGCVFCLVTPLPLNISHPPLSESSGWSPGPRVQARGVSVGLSV